MNKMIKYTVQFVLAVIFLVVSFSRCANIMTPQGGPKDSIPPVIVAMTPGMNTTNFKGKRIYIEFDEYVQVKDVHKEFYISPQTKKRPTVAVKGKGVQVEIKDTLLDNTTYSLEFGSSVSDNNEGNPLHGLRYVFSTGDEIDSLWISGYTADAMTTDSVSKTFIWFYPADSVPNIDSLGYDSTIFNLKPSFISRAQGNGIFLAQNLKPIDYRVYAVQDANNNSLYDAGTDKVGFIDSLFNPATMPEFAIWYDSLRQYTTADPQLFMRMFTDKSSKRQMMTSAERPEKHKAILRFSAPFPEIDSIGIEGIPRRNLLLDPQTKNRDTIFMWINHPTDELADTLRGAIKYYKHDSLNQLQPVVEKLTLTWRLIETKEQQKQREQEEKERDRAEARGEVYKGIRKKSELTANFDVQGEINPEHALGLTFKYPVLGLDTARIALVETDQKEMMTRIPLTLEEDTTSMLKWKIRANWRSGRKYSLMIPDSTLTDIVGNRNDTISLDFGVKEAEKFAKIVVKVTGKTPDAKYILQLTDNSGKSVKQ